MVDYDGWSYCDRDRCDKRLVYHPELDWRTEHSKEIEAEAVTEVTPREEAMTFPSFPTPTPYVQWRRPGETEWHTYNPFSIDWTVPDELLEMRLLPRPNPTERTPVNGWIGVDLDGTLAVYDGWQGPTHIGEPVPSMVERVKRWKQDGVDVRIMTARVSDPDEDVVREVVAAIERWCLREIGWLLPVTCAKDYGMVALYDDRAVSVVQNTGELLASPDLLERALAEETITP